VSVVAVYNGAKPVVIDTKDFEVMRNILGDLPMHHAFRSGKTKLFDGPRGGGQDRQALESAQRRRSSCSATATRCPPPACRDAAPRSAA
jgi:hypothetical protein